MNEALEQAKKNQAVDEEEIAVSKEKTAAPGEKADAFTKALGEFAGLR